ncbi:MAG: DNA-binding protein [Chitinophagaceae bacterium]
MLKEDLSEYKTLVIDTAGKAIDFLTLHICKKQPGLMQTDGTLSLKGYGVRKQAFSNFITEVTSLGKNIIFLAHEREEKDGDNRYIRPEIGGSSGNDLMKDLDLVGYVESLNNKRTISFNATDKFYGKNTAKLPARMEIPDYTGRQPVFLEEILRLYQQSMLEKQRLSTEYNALLDFIEENIDSVVDVETANEVAEKLKKIEHIWDSKLQAAYKLNTRASQLNLRFNKKSNQYEPIQSLAKTN